MSVIGNTPCASTTSRRCSWKSRRISAGATASPRRASISRRPWRTTRRSGTNSSPGLDRHRHQSDEVGGSGLDIGAAVPVLESMGRALLGTPLLSSAAGGAAPAARGGAGGEADAAGGDRRRGAGHRGRLESRTGWRPAGAPSTRRLACSGQAHGHGCADGGLVLVIAGGDESRPWPSCRATPSLTSALRPRVLIDHTQARPPM
jgi:hypothetical protein